MRFFYLFITIFLFNISCFAAQKPKLTVKSFSGSNFDLSKEKGHVVIVNFWASWCSQCRKEIIVLDKIYKKYRDKELVVIGISVDEPKFRNKAIQTAEKLSYQNALFDDALINDFEEPKEIPLPYIINKDGSIAKKIDAENIELDEEFFEKILADLL